MLRTRDLVGLQAVGDVWDSRGDVKVTQPFGIRLDAVRSFGRTHAVVLCLTTGLILAAGCGGARNAGAPTVPLSSSVRAQVELRAISATFAQSGKAERQELEPRLVSFQKRFAEDPLVSVADVMLAWIALDRGDLDQARDRSARAFKATKGRGTTADQATMIEGAALRRTGKSEAALDKLLPLRGKLIDSHARMMLNEELSTSALGAKRYGQAIDLMLAWLHESGVEHRAEIRAKLKDLVDSIPLSELLPILEKRHEKNPEPANEELSVQTTLVTRLADSALTNKDQALAARLLEKSSALLGSNAEAIAALARGGGGEARVEAPTLGFVLPVRSTETRKRGAEVARGIAFGLGLPGSDARLASRDDLGRIEGVEDALEGLVSDGAAIIIAGIDREEATIAASFAARESVPVVLLHPPASSVPSSPFYFVMGEEPERVRALLVSALKAQAPTVRNPKGKAAQVTPGQIVWVGDKGSVDMGLPESFECQRLPPSWRGIAGVAAYGSCISDVLLAVSGTSVQTAVGLDVEGVSLPKGTLAATAGLYPIDPRNISNATLSLWMRQHADPPNIWAGLGRDAAVLAWSAVQVLPARGTRDPEEVNARHRKAAETLSAAQAELWTTEARGFAGTRKLPRQVTVRAVK
jgi:hypothetical protein